MKKTEYRGSKVEISGNNSSQVVILQFIFFIFHQNKGGDNTYESMCLFISLINVTSITP